MADRDTWEKAESLSKIFAAVLIPVVLGFASLLANQVLEKSKTRDELLKQAIDVVFLSKTDRIAGEGKSFESRRAHRSHWLEIYNKAPRTIAGFGDSALAERTSAGLVPR